jgi:ankyrin repeat protein
MEEEELPLSSGLAGCCKAARLGLGLPESEAHAEGTPRPRLFHELVRLIDAMARKLERDERLMTMNGGDRNETLVEAARKGGVKDVRFLLASGADATAEDGWVLQYACQEGHLAVAEALLESGAAFSQVCLNSALWHAAYHGHTACCELLLDHGADVHYNQDHSLCYAARHGHLQTAALLLDRGANAWSERAMQYATDTLVSRRGRGAAPAATRSLRPAASIACIHQQEGRGANEGSVLPSFWRLAQMRL